MAWARKNTSVVARTGYYYEGKEIVLERQWGKLGRIYNNPNFVSEAKKVEVATVWAVTKDIKKTAFLTKMKPWVIRELMTQPWFDNVVSRVVKQQNDALDAKLTAVINQAVDVIHDRLVNGDYIKDNKTGEVERIPVKARDAGAVLETSFRQRQLIRGEATHRTESVSTDQKLAKLKVQFEKLATSKGINPEVEPIEGEPNESIPNEREGDEIEIESEDQSFSQEDIDASILFEDVEEEVTDEQEQESSVGTELPTGVRE